MGRVCSRCHIGFPGRDGFLLLWCTTDRFYVCRRCWEEGCHYGHGLGIKGARESRRSPAVGLLVLATIVLAPIVNYWVYDSTVLSAWHAGPPISIAFLQVGETAKVAGVLESATSVAIGGSQPSGYAWVWNMTEIFEVRDATGGIPVTVGDTWLIMPGPHLAPWAVTSSGRPDSEATMYARGDFAEILGRVVQGANGSRSLDAFIVSPTDTAPYPSIWDEWIPALSYGALAVGWMSLAVVAAERRVLHGRAIRDVLERDPEPVPAQKDPGVFWLPNGTWGVSHARATPVLLLAGAFTMGVGVFECALVPHSGIGFALWTGYLVILGMIVLTGAAVVFYRPTVPTAMGFSDSGLHLWYTSPYDWELHDTLVPWTEIKDVALISLPKGGHMYLLQRTDGEVDNLNYLSEENRGNLLTEWLTIRSRGANASAAAPARGGSISVRLRPGPSFAILLILGAMMLGILAFALWSLLVNNPDDPFYPSRRAGDIFVGSVVAVLAAAALAGAAWNGRDRTLLVDDRGVRLLRGTRVRRDLPWERVRRVRCGLSATPNLPYRIEVRGDRPSDLIRVASVQYRVSKDQLAAAGDSILMGAKARSIGVEDVNAFPDR